MLPTTFFPVAFFHFCHKMHANWKPKRIANRSQFCLFSKSHGLNDFLSMFSSRRTTCGTSFTSNICVLFIFDDEKFVFLKFWRIFVGKEESYKNFEKSNNIQKLGFLHFAVISKSMSLISKKAFSFHVQLCETMESTFLKFFDFWCLFV